jgi:hypothetical protein
VCEFAFQIADGLAILVALALFHRRPYRLDYTAAVSSPQTIQTGIHSGCVLRPPFQCWISTDGCRVGALVQTATPKVPQEEKTETLN